MFTCVLNVKEDGTDHLWRMEKAQLMRLLVAKEKRREREREREIIAWEEPNG
jgi:hypothetical protein